MKARWRKFVRNTYRSLRRPRYREKSGLRLWLAHRVFQRDLWRPGRRSVAIGVGIGLAVAMLPPIPVQMLLATVLAVVCRANVPAAAALVWVSNPATWGPIILFQRDIGRRVLPPGDGGYDVGGDISMETVRSVAFGVVTTSTLAGLLGFALVFLIWGWVQKPVGKR